MVLNFASVYSSMICIDLLNMSRQELHALCLVNSQVNVIKPYLYHLHKQVHKDVLNPENPNLVYMDKNCIVCLKSPGEHLDNYILGDFQLAEFYQDNKIDTAIFPFIESELTKSKSLVLHANLMDSYTGAFTEKSINSLFTFSLFNAHVEVSSNLVISPFKLATDYRIDFVFLENKRYSMKNKSLLLNTIYYRNEYPIMFLFKTKSGKDIYAWNEQFIYGLNSVEPINYGDTPSKLDTLNALLDKINRVGLSELTTDDMNFLTRYSAEL
jgi:hypothetical protein